MRIRIGIIALLLALCSPRAESWGGSLQLVQTNLVSDIPGLAANTDPQLKNPWGVSHTGTSPFWVSDQGTGVSTLYNGAGTKQGLVVTIPPPSGNGAGSPTGQISNGTTDFLLGPGKPAIFLFATLGGNISGWNPGSNPTNAINEVTNPNATYTGLTIDSNASGNFLLAANARAGGANHGIDVYDAHFNSTTLGANAFLAPNLPSGLTPYNVADLNGTIYVTYAAFQQPGGYVAAFDANGNFLRTVGANAPAGTFDAPWGLSIAPSTFGAFASDLLVGNFGSGTINAFDPTTGDFLGELMLSNGQPFSEPGLWAILPGNNGSGGSSSSLYFSAGINNEADGLFGVLTPVPEPAARLQAASALIFASATWHFGRWLKRRRTSPKATV